MGNRVGLVLGIAEGIADGIVEGIADIEGLPLSTVRGRLARARATIAKEMESWR